MILRIDDVIAAAGEEGGEEEGMEGMGEMPPM